MIASVPEPFELFPQLIFRAQYGGFDAARLVPICEGLVRGARENAYLEVGDARSSVINTQSMPHTLAVFRPFYDWLWPQVEHVIYRKWKLDRSVKYWINDSWVNRHGPGGQTTAHTHGHAVMAISAYIQVPKASGAIEFMDPLEMMWRMYFRNHKAGEWDKIPVEAGDVLMFPGWLDHRTEVSRAEPGMERWVLTSNVFCHKMERAASKWMDPYITNSNYPRVDWGKR
jgi:hypothetical protein